MGLLCLLKVGGNANFSWVFEEVNSLGTIIISQNWNNNLNCVSHPPKNEYGCSICRKLNKFYYFEMENWFFQILIFKKAKSSQVNNMWDFWSNLNKKQIGKILVWSRNSFALGHSMSPHECYCKDKNQVISKLQLVVFHTLFTKL